MVRRSFGCRAKYAPIFDQSASTLIELLSTKSFDRLTVERCFGLSPSSPSPTIERRMNRQGFNARKHRLDLDGRPAATNVRRPLIVPTHGPDASTAQQALLQPGRQPVEPKPWQYQAWSRTHLRGPSFKKALPAWNLLSPAIETVHWCSAALMRRCSWALHCGQQIESVPTAIVFQIDGFAGGAHVLRTMKTVSISLALASRQPL